MHVVCGCCPQYGEVTALLVSKKKNGSAIVEFSTHEQAVCVCNLSYLADH